MSNDAFGYRFLRSAGLVGARGLWLGVGIGAATVLAVTALARKGVRKVGACTEIPSETPAASADPVEPGPAPVRAVRAGRKTKAKAQDVPVRAVRAKRQPKVKAEASAETPETGEPAAKPASRRKRAAKPDEPSSQP